jgi:signal peptidase II
MTRPPQPDTPHVPPSRYFLFALIALAGAAFDLLSKHLIFLRVGPPPHSPPVPLIGNILELQTSHNEGALWGIGRNLPYSAAIFAALSILAACAICYWLFVKGAARDASLTAALALIMAGALGNCYDRIRFGYVRDFMHFHVDAINFNFPIFNFADNMLVLGSFWLMLMALKGDASARAPSSLAQQTDSLAPRHPAGNPAPAEPRP